MDPVIVKKLSQFFAQYKSQIYKKGQILIRADENPNGVIFLQSGLVKEYAVSKKGEELIINTYKPNTFFPMSWALNNTINHFYFEATTESKIFKAPRSAVLLFLDKNPDVLLDLMKRILIGTESILLKMTYLMSENAYDRVIAEILIDLKRFGTKIDEKGLMIKTSEKDLAAKTGMTRETISREIHILKTRKLVTYDKNLLVVPNLKKLELELQKES